MILIGTNRFPRSIQRDDHSCAPHCIYSIIQYYRKANPIEAWRSMAGLRMATYQDVYDGLHTSTEGTSAVHMVAYLRRLGFRAGLDTKMTLTKLTRALTRGPVIAFTDPEHFVVVYGRTAKYVWLSDPDPETKGLKISLDKFKKRFGNWGISISI